MKTSKRCNCQKCQERRRAQKPKRTEAPPRRIPWVILGALVALAIVCGTVDAVSARFAGDKRKSGAQLRLEALGGYQVGRVRMVHPDGREILIPRQHLPQMRRVGWILSP